MRGMSIDRELIGSDPLHCYFRIGLEPIRTTHQTDLRILRTGRQFIGKTSKSKVKKWGETFALLARRHRPDLPLEGPLWLRLVFAFPLNKADKGKPCAHTVKPDWDNLPKTVCDILTKEKFWHDDGQVVLGQVLKIRTKDPFVEVKICQARWIDEHFINQMYDKPD
jgi:Holliday junction resolvase RusA-like endonuclease